MSEYKNEKENIKLSLTIEYIYLILNSIFSIIFSIYESKNNAEWKFTPLLNSNQSLSWIILNRDYEKFFNSHFFPMFSLFLISMCMPYFNLVNHLRKEKRLGRCKKSIK